MISFKQSDLDELRNERKYLSDVFIEFYFTYLSSIHRSDSILFVPPTISFLLANSVDENDIENCVKPLEFPDKDLIFFPVNNGGIHWSLLVYCRDLNVFAHHDSFNGLNTSEARGLYYAVRDCVHDTESLRYRVEFRNKRRLMDGTSHVPEFVRPPTPRQKNGFDCGLYVMAMAKAICEWFCGDGEGTWLPEIQKLDDDNVGDTMRPLVLQLIRDAGEGRLGSVSCTIEEERCDDKLQLIRDASEGRLGSVSCTTEENKGEIEGLTSEELEVYQFWADFDDPVDPVPETFEDDLPLSSAAAEIVSNNSPSLVKQKNNNVKIPLVKVAAFNDCEMVDQSPSCDSKSASSSIVEKHKPVKDVRAVEKEEMGNILGTSDCRTSRVEREYLTQWPPEDKPTVEVKRGSSHSLLR